MSVTTTRTERWHRYWDKHSRTYDKQMGFFDRHVFGGSRDWACAQASGDVLEVAVGTGLNLDAYPDDITLTGLDLSDPMLDIARTRAARLGRDVTLLQGDAYTLPFPDASFDTVVCTFGLCAIPDAQTALAEMTRVLRPRGRLILVDHIESSSRVARAVQRTLKSSPYRWGENTSPAAHLLTSGPPDSTSNRSSASNSALSNASSPANPARQRLDKQRVSQTWPATIGRGAVSPSSRRARLHFSTDYGHMQNGRRSLR